MSLMRPIEVGLDRDLLTKLMMLTTSDADGEALSAIRKANQILKKEKLNWQEVLSLPKAVAPPTPAPFSHPNYMAEHVYLRAALNDLGVTFREYSDYFAISSSRVGVFSYYPTTGLTYIGGKTHRWTFHTLMMNLRSWEL